MKFQKMQDFANANGWTLLDLTLEIRLAEHTHAPDDAIFSRTNGTWETWRNANPFLKAFVTRFFKDKLGEIQ